MCAGQEKSSRRCARSNHCGLGDLEAALHERLGRRGTDTGFSFEPVVRTASYHSGTRRVLVECRDENRLDFALPVSVRSMPSTN